MSKSTGLPQEGQKRAVPATSLPHVEQRMMIVAVVYHRPHPGSDCLKQSLLNVVLKIYRPEEKPNNSKQHCQ
jgi:hypothetical protein